LLPRQTPTIRSGRSVAAAVTTAGREIDVDTIIRGSWPTADPWWTRAVTDVPAIPVVDIDVEDAPRRIDAACRAHGFFVVTGHGIGTGRFDRLEEASRRFFAGPTDAKAAIGMAGAGRAWRGWFPPGGELTGGVPDGKEGIYFGAELGPDHPRVAAGTPLHGANRFPDEPAELRPLVLEVLDELTALGHRLLELVATGLGLDRQWFRRTVTADPTVLFRIFHYPAAGEVAGASWGVQEHTDYGLLTILRQDDVGGLEVRTRAGWVEVPPVADGFVCNIGDMLERMTGGAYRSTPHRVRTPPRSRLSFPFFFDPSWDAEIVPVPGVADAVSDRGAAPPPRWDGRSVFDHEGTYGDYLSAKVAQVFPELWSSALDGEEPGDDAYVVENGS
jgi:isopenicillin N synthase-like dioxygenase